LGENLSIARKRRRESQAVWAQRLEVSIPTLKRMESGDPGVAMGIYATALWLIGRADALAALADPTLDHGALEIAVRQAQKRSTRRTTPLAAA
jgi:transcriptional regulator with XRE-family HTH domain